MFTMIYQNSLVKHFFRYSNKDDYYFSDKAGVQKKFFADTILENACMDYLAEIACAHNLAFIPCYTFCKFKSWKIRANPLYRSSHWQDWIFFKTKDDESIPVHLQLFVEIISIDPAKIKQKETENLFEKKKIIFHLFKVLQTSMRLCIFYPIHYINHQLFQHGETIKKLINNLCYLNIHEKERRT